jgi:hypothetical protein
MAEAPAERARLRDDVLGEHARLAADALVPHSLAGRE